MYVEVESFVKSVSGDEGQSGCMKKKKKKGKPTAAANYYHTIRKGLPSHAISYRIVISVEYESNHRRMWRIYVDDLHA